MTSAPNPRSRFPVDETHDDSWFEELYPQLHRVACVAAPADVEPDDLVQDALVRFLQREDLADVRSPAAYLTTTVVHLASNTRRSWSRRRRAIARLGPDTEQAPVDAYPSDLSDLEAVTARERAVLYLHHVAGYSFDEVGTLIGCSEAAARKTAERGRRRLNVRLEDDREHA